MKNLQYFLLAAVAALMFYSCEKVSPVGVLVAGTGVEDRVKMSNLYYQQHKGDFKYHIAVGRDEYTFLVGADSHMTTDDNRMREMLQNGLDHDDILYAHLGDIADTKAEYYINLEKVIEDYRQKYAKKYFMEVYIGEEDEEHTYQRELPEYYVYVDTLHNGLYSLRDVPFPFYPVVGNHDITHNGWALWSNIFHSSFYDVYVLVEYDPVKYDHFIFLDTANGTLGKEQVKLIEEGVLSGLGYYENESIFRHTFVFSHTNIFRPSSLQFASTFAREEAYFLFNQFVKWDASIVFCGHVHKWDDQEVGGVRYITLDSMSENNNPAPGDYLLRVHVKKDGTLTWERVHMNYTPKK